MRIIKLIIISIVSLLLIITIISLFIPSHVTMSRMVQIHASKESVMEQLSNPVNWKNWYPGADSTEYFVSEGAVKGLVLNKSKHHYIIVATEKKDEIIAEYVLPRRKILTGWELVSSTDSTFVTVQWYMDFHLRWYPWEKFSSFMFERIYNPQLEKGLNNLKTFLEK